MLSVLSNAAITGCQPMSGNLLWGSVACILLCKGQHSIVQIVQIEHTWEFSVLIWCRLRILSIVRLAGILWTIPFRDRGWRHRQLLAPFEPQVNWVLLSSILSEIAAPCFHCLLVVQHIQSSLPLHTQWQRKEKQWIATEQRRDNPEVRNENRAGTCNSLDQQRRGAERF